MNIHDATEMAYKNGYKDAVEEFAEKIKKYYRNFNVKTHPASVEYYIDQIAKDTLEKLK